MTSHELWLTSLFVRGAALPAETALWLHQTLMDASSTLQQAQEKAAGGPGATPQGAASAVVRARGAGGAQMSDAVVFPRMPTQLRSLSLLVDFSALGGGSTGPEPVSPPMLVTLGGKHRCSLHLAVAREHREGQRGLCVLQLKVEDWKEPEGESKWRHTFPPTASCHVTAWTAEGLQASRPPFHLKPPASQPWMPTLSRPPITLLLSIASDWESCGRFLWRSLEFQLASLGITSKSR